MFLLLFFLSFDAKKASSYCSINANFSSSIYEAHSCFLCFFLRLGFVKTKRKLVTEPHAVSGPTEEAFFWRSAKWPSKISRVEIWAIQLRCKVRKMCKQADAGVSVQEMSLLSSWSHTLGTHVLVSAGCAVCGLHVKVRHSPEWILILHFTAPKRRSPASTSFLIITGAGLDGVALKCLPENPGWPRGLGNNIKAFLYTVPGPLAHWVRGQR